jgi:hypothetical protein
MDHRSQGVESTLMDYECTSTPGDLPESRKGPPCRHSLHHQPSNAKNHAYYTEED